MNVSFGGGVRGHARPDRGLSGEKGGGDACEIGLGFGYVLVTYPSDFLCYGAVPAQALPGVLSFRRPLSYSFLEKYLKGGYEKCCCLGRQACQGFPARRLGMLITTKKVGGINTVITRNTIAMPQH